MIWHEMDYMKENSLAAPLWPLRAEEISIIRKLQKKSLSLPARSPSARPPIVMPFGMRPWNTVAPPPPASVLGVEQAVVHLLTFVMGLMVAWLCLRPERAPTRAGNQSDRPQSGQLKTSPPPVQPPTVAPHPVKAADGTGFTEGVFPIPDNEEERMRALHQLDILDTAAEHAFDQIVDWGRRQFDVPICLVSLVDSDRQWFKACYGLEATQTGRDAAFCAHAIMPGAPDIFEVPDTLLDPRFCNNPLVLGAPFIRYYAGAPISFARQKLGTLCIIDTAPHAPLDAYSRSSLLALARMVSTQMVSRLQSKELEVAYNELLKKSAEVHSINEELSSLLDTANAPIFAVDNHLNVGPAPRPPSPAPTTAGGGALAQKKPPSPHRPARAPDRTCCLRSARP